MLLIHDNQILSWSSHIELDLVNFCNKNCRDCSRCCDRFPADKSEFLSVGAVQEFVRDSIILGKVWLHIGCLGGEPTLHPCFDEIMNELKVYKEWSPSTRIWMMTNEKVKRKTPDFLEVCNSHVHDRHHAFYVSPLDLKCQNENFHCQAIGCGIGLGTLGYMPCVLGTAMGRVWGIKGIGRLVEATRSNLLSLSSLLCRHCGWRLVDVNDYWKGKIFDFPRGHATLSWKKKEEEYKARRLIISSNTR